MEKLISMVTADTGLMSGSLSDIKFFICEVQLVVWWKEKSAKLAWLALAKGALNTLQPQSEGQAAQELFSKG